MRIDHYLGDWQHVMLGGNEPTWVVPAPEYSALDLGSYAECSVAGDDNRQTRPACLVSVEEGHKPLEGFEFLGSAAPDELKLNGKAHDAWKKIVGYRPPDDAQTLAQMVWLTLTEWADPRGLDAVKPLIPIDTYQLVLGKLRWELPFDLNEPYFAKVIEVRKLTFEEIWEHEHSSDPKRPAAGTAQKYLGSLNEQYKLSEADAKLFVPDRLKEHVEGPLEPATDVGTETFNTADSTTLGPVLTWTETLNDSQVLTNEATVVTTGARVSARADHDLSSTDHYCQCDVTVNTDVANNIAGPTCRVASSGDSYYSHHYNANGGGTWAMVLAKIVTGIGTIIDTVTETAVPPQLWKVTAVGTTISGHVGGVEKNSVTDSALSVGVRIGFRLRANAAGNSKLDNVFGSDNFGSAGQPTARRFGMSFRPVEIGRQGARVA